MSNRNQWATARINPPHATHGTFGVDKRVKLAESDKERIRALHEQGTAQREIARQFAGVYSRRAIQFVLFPERLAIAKAQYKEHRKDGRYYDRDEWRATQRKHHAHLREVIPELSEGDKRGDAIRHINAVRAQKKIATGGGNEMK